MTASQLAPKLHVLGSSAAWLDRFGGGISSVVVSLGDYMRMSEAVGAGPDAPAVILEVVETTAEQIIRRVDETGARRIQVRAPLPPDEFAQIRALDPELWVSYVASGRAARSPDDVAAIVPLLDAVVMRQEEFINFALPGFVLPVIDLGVERRASHRFAGAWGVQIELTPGDLEGRLPAIDADGPAS